jgi:hypothetical protein
MTGFIMFVISIFDDYNINSRTRETDAALLMDSL